MFSKGCPRADELETLATAERGSSRLKRHVAECATCARIVAELRREARLIAELRAAVGDELDDRTRARVLEICDRAGRAARRGGALRQPSSS